MSVFKFLQMTISIKYLHMHLTGGSISISFPTYLCADSSFKIIKIAILLLRSVGDNRIGMQ